MTGIRLSHPLLLVALGGVLTACMACGIGATVVAMLTPQPRPTAVIEPTATTPPATPTITPVPTIVIQPTPDVRVARYVASLQEPIDQMVDGLLGIVALLQNPLGTPAWRADLRYATQEVSNAHYAVTRLEPPPGWEDFHERLKQATYQCSLASDMLYTATSDTSYLQLAVGAMQRCNSLVEQVSNELGERSRP
jgi:hypothetical protein